MNWKKFINPQVSKIFIFVLLILILGVPTSVTTCGWERCREHFEVFNPWINLFRHTTDASFQYDYNPLVVSLYLIILYLSLSLVFHISNYNWKKFLLYLVIIGIVIGIILIIYFIYSTKVELIKIY